MPLAIACLLAAGGPAVPARAEDVPAAQVASLAERAAGGDAAALDRLRGVRQVDGRPVDLSIVLTASGDDLMVRLRELGAAAGGTGTAVDPASAREEAGRILQDRRFKPVEPPRPLRGLLDLIARGLLPLGDAYEAVRRFVSDLLPPWAAIPLLGIILGLAAVLTASLRRRRAPGGRADAPPDPREDPAELDARAAAAEAAGDHAAAVRLRFRAGLVRLGTLGAIAYRPSITSAEVAGRIASQSFPAVAARHDEIAYGGRPASPADAAAAKDSWHRVYQEVGRT